MNEYEQAAKGAIIRAFTRGDTVIVIRLPWWRRRFRRRARCAHCGDRALQSVALRSGERFCAACWADPEATP